MSNAPGSKRSLHALLLPNRCSHQVNRGFGEGKGNPQSCEKFGEIGTKKGQRKEGNDEIMQ